MDMGMDDGPVGPTLDEARYAELVQAWGAATARLGALSRVRWIDREGESYLRITWDGGAFVEFNDRDARATYEVMQARLGLMEE